MPESSTVCSPTWAAREAALPTLPPQLDLGVRSKKKLRSWNAPAPRKRAQLCPQPFLPLHGQHGCADVGANGVMPPPARLRPWPGQLRSVQSWGACLVRAGTCLGLCSLRGCAQQNLLAGQGRSSPAFPSSAPQHAFPAKSHQPALVANLRIVHFGLFTQTRFFPPGSQTGRCSLGF